MRLVQLAVVVVVVTAAKYGKRPSLCRRAAQESFFRPDRGIVVGGGVAVMLLKNAPSPLNSLDTDKENAEKLEEIATISPLKQPWIA